MRVLNATNFRKNSIDVNAAIVGLVLAIILLPLRTLSSEPFITAIPVALGLACLSYLVIRRRYESATERSAASTTELPTVSVTISKLSTAAFVFGLGGLVLIAQQSNARTVPFLLLAAALAGVILLQLFFVRDDAFSPGTVLAQIIALSVVVRFASLYTTPGFVGVDTWTHITLYAQPVFESQSLSPLASVKYYAAPLYHIIVVTTAQWFGVPLREALFLSMGVVMALFAITIFGTARFFVDARWAVAAVALYAVADHVVRWGINLIPTSLGLVFFVVIMYYTVRLLSVPAHLRDYGMILLFSVAVIFTHQVSAFITLVLLGAGMVVQLLFKFGLDQTLFGESAHKDEEKGNPLSLTAVAVVYAGVLVLNWSVTPFAGTSFLEFMPRLLEFTVGQSAEFLNLIESASPPAVAEASGSGQLAVFVSYFDGMGYFILFFLTIIGSLVVLDLRDRRDAGLVLVAVTAIMMVFTFALPLFGIRTFIPSRWYAFMYAPMVIVGSLGLSYLAHRVTGARIVVALLIFALVFPGTMLMAQSATEDNPVFPDHNIRYAYSESELAAVYATAEIDPASGRAIFTDHPYQTVFPRSGSYEAGTIRFSESGAIETTGVLVYRSAQSDGATSFETGSEALGTYDVPESVICPQEGDKMYDNGDAHICRVPEPETTDA
ncbi:MULTISPECIES: hypothetical protein [Haloferax]|uniref:Glycosyltransferase RgtA/B/C/D-like domain-containing protein n=2 Tax=Haloferax TaxID=2251 RepID=A0A6G1Z726_9EURY|nr:MULTISPECIES: hypothetical protein [Haloferax]KAB1185116.1 hypothetical protein Hfx1149_16475 [Haloferax sp. CBA1149]MRW82293.1 hypothetical protein [Haloferax marinisediminis]